MTPNKYAVKPIPFKAHKLIGLSDNLLESHYENNYGGAVRKLNAIEQKLNITDINTMHNFDVNGIKREQLIASNSIILHEVYFDGLGEEGGVTISGEINTAINQHFSNYETWQTEFTKMAEALAGGSGWVILAWSKEFNRLINISTSEHLHNLAGAVPILALDMYEHAYHIDYGSNASAYIQAFMQNIHWDRINKRFLATQHLIKETVRTELDSQQMSVDDVQSTMTRADKKLLLIDVRLQEDLQRSNNRITDTRWLDPEQVSEWGPQLPKDTLVVVYCLYGFWVSQQATAQLRELGVQAYKLSGGISAWRAMGYATTALQQSDQETPV